jgi:hypothetical protein
VTTLHVKRGPEGTGGFQVPTAGWVVRNGVWARLATLSVKAVEPAQQETAPAVERWVQAGAYLPPAEVPAQTQVTLDNLSTWGNLLLRVRASATGPGFDYVVRVHRYDATLDTTQLVAELPLSPGQYQDLSVGQEAEYRWSAAYRNSAGTGAFSPIHFGVLVEQP